MLTSFSRVKEIFERMFPFAEIGYDIEPWHDHYELIIKMYWWFYDEWDSSIPEDWRFKVVIRKYDDRRHVTECILHEIKRASLIMMNRKFIFDGSNLSSPPIKTVTEKKMIIERMNRDKQIIHDILHGDLFALKRNTSCNRQEFTQEVMRRMEVKKI